MCTRRIIMSCTGVTPIFEGDDLVASGVIMEAESVEDDGEGVCFHVYVYKCSAGYRH